MASYRLSEQAAEDFESIYIFGLLNFGLRQADIYADGMEARIEQIATQPELYPSIEHVMSGYRLSVYRSRSIYYRLDDCGVVIVRILRSQDVGAALE
ncbi:MAG: type II toxin-antitoxin system RelE/ParE family toxin [Alteromonadaceae bacterium]|uniref:type II toxin-antitoxin system RelE/ParE family toxin n=1 Tax=Marinobacter sp. TaxID=50741 RepID=UPI0029C4EF8D|nr:type II toxin-antitoxin system RelE/ParE family toxin [Marinobacter sp.]MDX5385798.1 type II toxin-antitoxin system RelE/ParE family toxin [Marinobacter sp.]MDX5440043.1 type II toxin-antitoxin system RelE/ParE family toxin [Alteromonadaceae bacterium]